MTVSVAAPHDSFRPAFWAGKRVLLTGHTGFKGSWLALWLARQGAAVTGIALAPQTSPDLWTSAGLDGCCDSHVTDIRDAEAVRRIVALTRPEIVFHLAAQALVRASYRDPLGTFSTNAQGTAHVLEAVRQTDGIRAVVVVTTDKVYRNNEWPWPYREDDALGGHDPYSASKAASEVIVECYRRAFLIDRGVAVSTARAGNVIGGGDWSEDRLLPDAIRAWGAGVPLEVRRPMSTRPWQHVLEPLSGYLTLAQALWERGDEVASAYNFGPPPHEAATVHTVIEQARRAFPGAAVNYAETPTGPHEAGWLALETARAREQLGVTPRLALADAVRMTIEWYRRFHAGTSARSLCEEDISAFQRLR
ncbi:MAG: CDP-glucose 4,6-dehydratase [Planctomycetes bacterium]|nr:CDP-glucose 4,6-dehydratase [Planctomycetota bacterium]